MKNIFIVCVCVGDAGIDRFCQDIKAMTGFCPGIYWRVCWKFIAPIFLMVSCVKLFTVAIDMIQLAVKVDYNPSLLSNRELSVTDCTIIDL